MADAQEYQGLHHLSGVPQRDVRHGDGPSGAAAQLCIHAQALHVVLEIVESGVDETVPAQLGVVHIVQLIQDDLEGLVQGGNHGGPVVSAALLHAEIRVDERQGLRRQVLRLQIPGGMVGRDMADVLHVMACEPFIRIVIVKIGDALVGLAAEFPQVVAGRRAGGQRHVDGHSRPIKPPCDGQRHVVDAGDVLQRAESGDLSV